VAAGERIILARNGKPCAQLVPLDPAPRRRLGFLKGSIDAAFFEPLPEEELHQASAVVHNYRMALDGLAAAEIPISGEVARRAGLWEVPHRDPFDRLLAAQAVSQELVLASNDQAFSQFEGVVRLS
jgi:hypothetical protein